MHLIYISMTLGLIDQQQRQWQYSPYHWPPWSSAGAVDPTRPPEARSTAVSPVPWCQAAALQCEGWRDTVSAVTVVPPCPAVSWMYCRYQPEGGTAPTALLWNPSWHVCFGFPLVNFWYDMEYDIKYNYYQLLDSLSDVTTSVHHQGETWHHRIASCFLIYDFCNNKFLPSRECVWMLAQQSEAKYEPMKITLLKQKLVRKETNK